LVIANPIILTSTGRRYQLWQTKPMGKLSE